MKSEWIKMGLLLMSEFGYWEYFRSKHRIQIYFTPVFTISVQFAVLFAAGLLNCLKEASYLLYGFGFFLLMGQLYREKLRIFLPYINTGYLFCAAAFFVIGFLVHDKLFSQIDNFTHWATVVRSMLGTDRFPSFQDTVIEFVSYPLGSSALIYFVCKMTGEAEHMMMWAQAYLMLCAIVPVFACCQKQKGAYLALVAAMTGFLLNYNIPVTELLIDTLMPLAAMAAAWFIYYHYSECRETVDFSPYYCIPMLVWVMNIKIAALLFVIFALILLYLCIGKEAQGKGQWALVAAAVALFNVLWNRHCDYVFVKAASSRHSISLNWFRTILGGKTAEEIADTLKMVCLRVATRTEGLWLVLWVVILGALVWLCAREEKKRYGMFLLGGFSLYGAYVLGITGMYVFSMEDYGELLAFTRYMRSADVALYYMITIFSGLVLSKLAKKQLAAGVSLVLVLLTAAGWRWQTGKYLKEQLARCSEEWRLELEQPISEVEPGKRYLLCIPEDYHGWPRRIWRYNLQTSAVDHVVVTDVSELDIAKKYDYVIILDTKNPMIASWVEENHPDDAGRQVIRQFS